MFVACVIREANYSRMDQVKFFKGCLPQILLGLFLNTLSHVLILVEPLMHVSVVEMSN